MEVLPVPTDTVQIEGDPTVWQVPQYPTSHVVRKFVLSCGWHVMSPGSCILSAIAQVANRWKGANARGCWAAEPNSQGSLSPLCKREEAEQMVLIKLVDPDAHAHEWIDLPYHFMDEDYARARLYP